MTEKSEPIEQIKRAIAVLLDDSLSKDARALVADILIGDIQRRITSSIGQ